jgi:prepilin-type N-terminal cleavage/methylation domain-containing protein
MRKGFTLLELLVVIAIIGLLAALIIASMQSARKRAYRGRILEQVREMRKTAELYVADNARGFYPPHESGSVGQFVLSTLQCKDPGGQYKWINFGTFLGGANGVNGACVGVGYWNTIGWQKTLLFVGEYDGVNPNGCVDNQNTMRDVGTFADYLVNRCY